MIKKNKNYEKGVIFMMSRAWDMMNITHDYSFLILFIVFNICHLSHFIIVFNSCHLSLFIIAYDEFDIADPSSLQDACHI